MTTRPTLTLRVALNGTTENPFEVFGLTQNPFPQLAIRELDASMFALASLGAAPIPNVEHIRSALAPFFSPAFVDFIVDKFVPGEMRRFEVTVPDPRSPR